MVRQYEQKKNQPWYQAAMDVILRANWKAAEEEIKMCDALRELFAEELAECKEEGIQLALMVYKAIYKTPNITNRELMERFQCSEKNII